MQLAETDAFFIVDSDDYLTKDAVKLVNSWFLNIANLNDFTGVSGLKANQKMVPYGGYPTIPSSTTPPPPYIDATNLERKKYNLLGDKAEVYKTSILKKYPFPEFEGEKFVTEAQVWNRIALDGYKLRWYSNIIYICEYLPDGLTHKGANLSFENPQGHMAYIDVLEKIHGKDYANQMRFNFYFNLSIRLGGISAAEKMKLPETMTKVFENERQKIFSKIFK